MGKHNHNYTGCNHDLHYCSHCDLVYCTKCSREWGGYHAYWGGTYPYTFPGVTYTASADSNMQKAVGVADNYQATMGGGHIHG